ncbi:hypothetical protein SAMN05428642_101917 [Flaviramulus basaltis]|uniref:DUF4374 domain-containing protein n=1 Tax=Flaviramulus basaltis TaxID=369401 RepID=A0A1K2IDA6_9FLAO|nr:hypothetical protein [Flaviramulus basaltis]SFZ90405.1 hypothetical protein SAMN05428642_101917 [Flaviramulus basaltis]
MNQKIQFLFKFAFISLIALTVFSCSEDDSSPIEKPDPSSQRSYHLVIGSSSTGNSATYTQGATVEELNDPEKTFSFTGYGFEVPSTRTARLYSSTDGNTLYNLNYGGGDIAKYNHVSGQNYNLDLTTDIQTVMGTAYPRWTKIDDDYAILHYVASENLYDDPDAVSPVYQRTKATVTLALVNLSTMSVVENTSFEFPWNETEASLGIYASRIDAPVITNGKLYYGVAKSVYDPLTDDRGTMVYEDVETLVVNYPSLENPTTIRSSLAAGSTNGYRTPVAHKDENGDTYQLVTSGDVSILKISNGAYDTSYTFNIKSILGHNAEANTGWFYVGNGIGYIPVLNTDLGGSSSSNWDIVRVDIYNKTAVKMNIPLDLWLRQYQWASVINGKLYMALASLGGEGKVYIFDPTSSDANGYITGATLQTGTTDASYIGLF